VAELGDLSVVPTIEETQMAEDVDVLAQRRASDVLRDSDRTSVGLVRILSEQAGTAGEVREYEDGDEALVEAGQAVWVVAPVHSPAAGRRLDATPGAAEREALPRDGIEAYPPADGSVAREDKARADGYVEAHSSEGLGEKIAARRVEVAKSQRSSGEGDAKTQAHLGGMGARSGPVSAQSDLPADKQLAELAQASSEGDRPATKAAPAKAASKSGDSK
jgi:hypothetical protein